jgi:hypothetical protein
MPIGLFTILKSVPWTEVISNAPKVVDGAKKLWNTVGKNSSPPNASDTSPKTTASPEFQAIAAIEARTVALEAAVSDLHGQMLATSELIKTLADQNAQLIQRIEINRVRMLWLSAATVVITTAAVLGLLMAFSRHVAA